MIVRACDKCKATNIGDTEINGADLKYLLINWKYESKLEGHPKVKTDKVLSFTVVASYTPLQNGDYDMRGEVEELCSDCLNSRVDILTSKIIK